MFLSTEGILLRKTKLSGNGYILKVFTQEKGVKSFFTRKSKKDKAVLQHLSIITIESYFKEDKEVNNLKEISISSPFINVYSDMVKSNILLFLNEILDKSIQEEEKNEELYTFLKTKLQVFDKDELDINFHLSFLIELANFLGFKIENTKKGTYFNLEDGDFLLYEPSHPHYLSKDKSTSLWGFIQNKEATISNDERKLLIHSLVDYYKYHLDIKDLKSLPILEVIFG